MANLIAGIDIGFESLKVVGLQQTGKGFRLEGMNTSPLPANSWMANQLRYRDEISQILTQTLRSAKPSAIDAKHVMVALPESVIFSGTFAMEPLAKKELEQALPFEIAEKLSINVEDYYIDYEIADGSCRPGQKPQPEPDATKLRSDGPVSSKVATRPPAIAAQALTVFAVAAKKSLVESVVDLCKATGLSLGGIDVKPGAAVRSAVTSNDQIARLVVDLGASASVMSVAEGNSLRLTTTTPIGTKLYDQSSIDANRRREILTPVFDELVHVSKYFENRVCPGLSIKQIVLCGGGSNVEGIASVFQRETGLPTVLADPFSQVDTHHYPIKPELSRIYTIAIGLAMRGIEK